MILQVALISVAIAVIALSIFVWRARPYAAINRHFAAATFPVAIWAMSISGVFWSIFPEVSLRLSFAGGSLIPCAFLAFVYAYPTPRKEQQPRIIQLTYFIGIVFAVLSVSTNYVGYGAAMTADGLTRHTGTLYPLFGLYCFGVLATSLLLLAAKWRRARGLARTQMQYLGVGAIVSIVGGLTTNLALPLLTQRSTYGWLGPFFLFPFIALVAHAIIRHRLMDLRLVIHRSLTVVLATIVSLAPIALLFAMFWNHIPAQVGTSELTMLLAAFVLATLLVPPTRDIAGRFLDKYVYRTHTNFRRTVVDASRRFTRFLDLPTVLSLITDSVVPATKCEAIGVYLEDDAELKLARTDRVHRASPFQAPLRMTGILSHRLRTTREMVIIDELARERGATSQQLHQELTRLNWALVLPLLSEEAVIGAIVVGPKLSRDAFYPQDLDLLMTLANQAGIAIKNAQLYTEVLLANEYIENVVATIESGVVAVNAGAQITRFNRAAAQLTAMAPADVLGQPVDALPEVLSGLLSATLGDGRDRTEPEIALPGGATSWPVICTTSPLRDPGGAIVGAVAVFSDLTPLKELELERQRVERLAYFEILASSIAHEIKNPLVAIKTFAQLIPRRHADAQFVDEFSRVVTREIGRMERLVERLRTLSRPSNRPKHRLDVRTPLHEAVDFLRPTFVEKRIELRVRLGPEPRFVLGEPGELEQLFLNLLMNAYEATPPDGSVEIAVEGGPEQAIITVADSGPGFAADMLPHVFDPFITTKPRGSGLGLTICAGIAASYRAKLRAENRPDGGALLTVEFPIAAQVEAAVRA